MNHYGLNTLLDNILPELQSIINKYIRDYPIFVIGKYQSHYDDYRIVNRNDINNEKFKMIFLKYLEKCGGLPAVDSFDGSILCGDECVCWCRGYLIRCTKTVVPRDHDMISIKFGDVIPFYITFILIASLQISKIDDIKAETMYLSMGYRMEKVGLYIRTNICVQ